MRRINLFKKILLSGFWMLLLSTISYAQTVTINQTPGSTTGNGPMGSSTYHISEHIFLQTETGIPTGIPIPIEFVNFYINLPATAFPNTFNNVSIYVRTVTGSVFAASSTYTGTAGYTLLYSGSMTFNAAGFGGVSVTPGTFTYANTAGTNLAFLIIRNNSSGNPGHNFYSSTGNSTNTATTNLTCRRYNSTLAPVVGSSVLSGTGFRTAIQFGKILNNDVSVNQVYTLGKMPIEYGAPTTIQAHVTNTGVGAVTNVPVTLNIT
ncbi:MAG: hypothetical protein JNM95_05130 [Chitinophagaceae bacterium]|nr:hypothetical protein [Chitinophagaceae bacterium]